MSMQLRRKSTKCLGYFFDNLNQYSENCFRKLLYELLTNHTMTNLIKGTLLLLVLCICPCIFFGQITYAQEFSGCTGQTCEKWKLSGGLVQISATPVLGCQPISPNNPAALGNVNKFQSVILNTTSALGISNGQPATFGFTYKCTNFHSGESSPALSVAFDVYWAASQVGPWYLLESFINYSNHK